MSFQAISKGRCRFMNHLPDSRAWKATGPGLTRSEWVSSRSCPGMRSETRPVGSTQLVVGWECRRYGDRDPHRPKDPASVRSGVSDSISKRTGHPVYTSNTTTLSETQKKEPKLVSIMPFTHANKLITGQTKGIKKGKKKSKKIYIHKITTCSCQQQPGRHRLA